MKIYISGPMTGLPEHNFPAFNAAAAELQAAGYEVENPAEKGIIAGWSWSDYLRHDLALLVGCQGVALLPRWEHSRGAQLEVDVARQLGMPVEHLLAWTGEWVPFGTHLTPGAKLKFSGTGEDGLPLWELRVA